MSPCERIAFQAEEAVNFGCRLIFHGRAAYGRGLEPVPETQPVPRPSSVAAAAVRYEGVQGAVKSIDRDTGVVTIDCNDTIPLRNFLILADAVGLRGDA